MNEMQFLKKYRNFMMIISLVYLIVGIALMLAPERMGNILGFVFGAIAFVFGIYRLVVYFRQPKLELMLATDLFIGVGCTVLGFVSLLCYRQVLTYATFIFGFLLIAAGVVKMQNSINLQQLGYDNWWISMILGFASIGLSVVVFVKPKPVADNFLFIMGAFFVFAAAAIVASLVMSEMYYNRLRKNPEMDAVPARSSVSNPFSGSSADAAPAAAGSAHPYYSGQAAGAAAFKASPEDASKLQDGAAADGAAAAAGMSAVPAAAPQGSPFESLMFWKKKKNASNPQEAAEKTEGEASPFKETPMAEDPFLAESVHDSSASGFSFDADSKTAEAPAEAESLEPAPEKSETGEAAAAETVTAEAEDTFSEVKMDAAQEETPAASDEAAPWEAPAAEEAPAAQEAAPAAAEEGSGEDASAPSDEKKETQF